MNRHRLLGTLLVTSAISVLFLFTSCKRPGIGYNKGYAPEQPIAFDHALHAGTNKIQCLYCHTNAEHSKAATVPSLNICMNCHLSVATDRPEVKKLVDAYNNKKPVKWVRVHMLPEFVKFDHAAHTSPLRGDKQCQECHGPVERMTRLEQHTDLSMGWCVECHTKPENKNTAPSNCTTCHH